MSTGTRISFGAIEPEMSAMFKTIILAASIAALPMIAAADSHIAGDAAKGEKVFRKCKACHAVGEGAKNKVGPALNGVIDRQIAADADFKYSKALTELKSLPESAQSAMADWEQVAQTRLSAVDAANALASSVNSN